MDLQKSGYNQHKRETGVEVIYTAAESLTLDGIDRNLDYGISGIFAARGLQEAEVIDEIKPHENDIVIPRTSSSLCNSTNFTSDKLVVEFESKRHERQVA